MTERHGSPRHRIHEGSPVRQAAGVTAAGLFAGAAVLLATRGGHPAKKYDAETEAKLQHAIRPTMVRIARQAVKLEEKGPSAEQAAAGVKVTANLHEYGKVPIAVTRNDGYAHHRHLDVVIGTKPGAGKDHLDPKDVEYVEVDTRSTAVIGVETGWTCDYAAVPDAEPEDAHLVFTDDQPTSWSAGTSAKDYRRQRDASDPYYFEPVGGGSGNPIETARYAVTQALAPAAERILQP